MTHYPRVDRFESATIVLPVMNETASLEETVRIILRDVGDRSRLDLATIALSQLAQCGVAAAAVTLCSATTDDGAIFFSYRAQRPCGRFGLVARRFYDSSQREGIQ